MNKTKALSYGVGTLLALIGISAVAAGAALMWNSDGGMGLTVDMLKNSPFANYFIPGLFLFTVNGLFSLIVAFYAFRKHRFAGVGTLLLGAMMIIWIVFQVYWLGWTSWLQPVMLAVGVIEMGLGVTLNELNSGNHSVFQGHHGSHAH